MVTYSAMPRGGAVHARRLAEELAERGHDVELWVLMLDGTGLSVGSAVDMHEVSVPRVDAETAPARVDRAARYLAGALRTAPPADIHHAHDLLAARALLTLRAEGVVPHVVRTVHHVEMFEDRFLEECQRASIQDVDSCTAVSAFWADRLADEFGVDAAVVPNGVDAHRFAACPLDRAAAGTRMGWGGRPVVLAVGGVQSRKGGRVLLEAFARARGRLGEGALLVIAGAAGIYADPAYVTAWTDDAARLGLRVHDGPLPPADAHVARIGIVDEDLMPTLYRAADVLAFPSTREGFGLVVVEAMAAGIPVVASDIPVLAEFLVHDEDCLMVPVGDSRALAEAITRLVNDHDLTTRLTERARETVARYPWTDTAARAEAVYTAFARG